MPESKFKPNVIVGQNLVIETTDGRSGMTVTAISEPIEHQDTIEYTITGTRFTKRVCECGLEYDTPTEGHWRLCPDCLTNWALWYA